MARNNHVITCTIDKICWIIKKGNIIIIISIIYQWSLDCVALLSKLKCRQHNRSKSSSQLTLLISDLPGSGLCWHWPTSRTSSCICNVTQSRRVGVRVWGCKVGCYWLLRTSHLTNNIKKLFCIYLSKYLQTCNDNN